MLFSLFKQLYDHNRCIITNQVRCEIRHLTLIPVELASSFHLSKSISGLENNFFADAVANASLIILHQPCQGDPGQLLIVNYYDVKNKASRDKNAQRDLSYLSG